MSNNDEHASEFPRAPAGCRVYAIGDIHGRLDLLQKLHQEIRTDILGCRAKRKVLIYLGDYVDRGFHSKEVIDYLLSSPLPGFEAYYLKGNHEYAMQVFMTHPDRMAAWLNWGGASTLQSYGVNFYTSQNVMKSLRVLGDELAEAVPQSHKDFLNNLSLYHTEGDYLFVHAGIKPGKELHRQTLEDLTMIRDEFLYTKKSLPYTVVFGHSIFETPFLQTNRIGIDTGAYFSGKLTAVVLEEQQVRFLST